MKEIVHRLKFSARLFPVMVLLGISIQLSFSYIMTFLLSLNEAAEKEYDEVIAPLVSMEPSMIFYVGFGAPFLEELLFRGVVLGTLVLIINRLTLSVSRRRVESQSFTDFEESADITLKKGGTCEPVLWYAVANIIQALLFALYHGNIYQGTYAFIIGLIFGYIFILTGSALPGMVAHSSVNLFGLFAERLIPPDISPILQWVLAFAGLLGMVLSIHAARRKVSM
jgi:membrane protease YdiL (CAAX protease family)